MDELTHDQWWEQRRATIRAELHNQARPTRPDYVPPPADAFTDPDVQLVYDRIGNIVGWHYISTGTRKKD